MSRFIHYSSRSYQPTTDNHSEIEVLGLVCTVDLFPVPDQVPTTVHRGVREKMRPHSTPATNATFARPLNPTYSPEPKQYAFIPSQMYPVSQGSEMVNSDEPPQCSPPHPASKYPLPTPPAPSDIVYRVGESLVSESSKMTQALVGATFVQPSCVDYQGKKTLMFVFSVRLPFNCLSTSC